MELVITIDNGGEDGRLFIKGSMLGALRDEVRRQGLKKPEVGGKIAVKYSHDGENKNPKLSPPKMYVVAYEPPAAVAVEALINTPAAPAAGGAEMLNSEALAALLSSQ